jgi:hypothetical protein
MAGASAGSRAEPLPADFRVLTWNLLAAPYFRVPPEASGQRRPVAEAVFRGVRRRRLAQELAALSELEPDILAIQELWFKDEVLASLTRVLGDRYESILVQRPCGKQDGVALLVRRSRLRVLQWDTVKWDEPDKRCAAMAVLEPVDAPGSSFVACCTHLTYPETAFDQQRRIAQAGFVVAAVDSLAAAAGIPGCPALIAGDMNAVGDEAVAVISGAGYTSSFCAVHGRAPVFSHLDHTCKGAGVDAVFYRPGKGTRRAQAQAQTDNATTAAAAEGAEVSLGWTAHEAYLLPRSIPDDTPMTRPVPQVCLGLPVGDEGEPAAAQASSNSSQTTPATPATPSPASTPLASPCGVGAGAGARGGADAFVDAATGLSASLASSAGRGEEGQGEGEGACPGTPLPPGYTGGDFASVRPISALSFTDFCNLSDHRPLMAVLTMRASGPGDGEAQGTGGGERET